jgi:hypothetical protein
VDVVADLLGIDPSLAFAAAGALVGIVLLVWGFVTYRNAESAGSRTAATAAITVGVLLWVIVLLTVQTTLSRTG